MLDALRSEKLELRSTEVGGRWKDSLARSLSSVPGAGEVRGSGLMLGIAVGRGTTALALQRALLEAGYLVTIGGSMSEVLVVTPALTIAENLLEGFASTLCSLLEAPRTLGGGAPS
jgi:4-aminobutyrate aminotransferase-like enzyme